MSLIPSQDASTEAVVAKVGVVTGTAAMPALMAAIAGRATAGVQVPQPPLPVITASQPFSSRRVIVVFTRSNISSEFNETSCTGNSS
jgi:hypothetical protein